MYEEKLKSSYGEGSDKDWIRTIKELEDLHEWEDEVKSFDFQQELSELFIQCGNFPEIE